MVRGSGWDEIGILLEGARRRSIVGLGIEGGFEGGGDLVDGAVPESWVGRVNPAYVRWVESRFVPIVTLTHAAVRQRLCGPVGGEKGELFRDEMMRIPELADAVVGDARESAAAGPAPVGWKNGLPDDQDAEISIAVMLEDLLDCG